MEPDADELTRLGDIYDETGIRAYFDEVTVTDSKTKRLVRYTGIPWPLLKHQLRCLRSFLLGIQAHALDRHPKDKQLYLTAHRARKEAKKQKKQAVKVIYKLVEPINL